MSGAGGVWKVVRETAEIEADLKAARERMQEIESGLARCSECGGKVGVHIFGQEGHGVWIGCDRSFNCSRHIEYHAEGWSIAEVAAEWNRYNSGVMKYVRKAKSWFWKRFGRINRQIKRYNAAKKAEEKAKKAIIREVLGVKEGKREGKIKKILKKGYGFVKKMAQKKEGEQK